MAKKGDVPSARRGRPKEVDESQISKLRRENERLREDNEILKKAAAYFSRHQGIVV